MQIPEQWTSWPQRPSLADAEAPGVSLAEVKFTSGTQRCDSLPVALCVIQQTDLQGPPVSVCLFPPYLEI